MFQVEFQRPEEDAESWFHLLVLHQNRAKRGPTNYIPEGFLPSFFHLVIWGHEHDCRITPENSDMVSFNNQTSFQYSESRRVFLPFNNQESNTTTPGMEKSRFLYSCYTLSHRSY